jgi:hypothetical protein
MSFNIDKRPLKFGDAHIIDPDKKNIEYIDLSNTAIFGPVFTVSRNSFMRKWHERSSLIGCIKPEYTEEVFYLFRENRYSRHYYFNQFVIEKKYNEDKEFVKECTEGGF